MEEAFLVIGKTLGHYRVGEQLGRGGMGEVYVADDLNLNRKVALKFLPDAFAGDPERMARFEREAKLLASLNHPNIAAIYGLEQVDGKRFIVMELVEGETLQQRISNGALPVDEALGFCCQMAEGLEAAHEKGVIHRDLKPANVMITEGDKVKILDFGLAKALSDETQTIDSSQSPTLTEAMTRPGVILGTAAYMSPEQVKGKSVDKRTDIWAFGCILYECLTGKRAFEGETVTETLAAVLTRDPDLESVPAKVRLLLRRCLERDPKKRLRDIGDTMPLLEALPESPVVKRSWLAWGVAVIAVLIAITSSLILFRQKAPAETELRRVQIGLPEKVRLVTSGAFAISPDGRYLAFGAMDSDGGHSLWLRSLDSFEAHPIPGSESGWVSPFFWSPDSRFIVFCADNKLKKISISGGMADTLCDMHSALVGGSWNQDDVIIFGADRAGIARVYASGGNASLLTKLNPERSETAHYYPVFLPDGRRFIYFCASLKDEYSGVYIGSLDSKPEEQVSKKILATTSGVAYLPSQDSGHGQLMFLSGQRLLARRFDERQLELSGESVTVAEQVSSAFGYVGHFSASNNGVLVYRSGWQHPLQLTWFDRQGNILSTSKESGAGCLGLDLHPGGEQAAVSWIGSEQSASKYNVYLCNFIRDACEPFTVGKANNFDPIWSPDGTRILFLSDREDNGFYQKPANRSREEELLYKSTNSIYPSSWSVDGRFFLYSEINPKTESDLAMLPMNGDHKQPVPVLNAPSNEDKGRFSPNNRWIAYVSDVSGLNEVYVQEFSSSLMNEPLPAGGGRMVSKGGGTAPRWRRDSRELYYRALDGNVMVVEVDVGPEFKPEMPKFLFAAPAGTPIDRWDVAQDGKRFLLLTPAAGGSPPPFNVIFNWTALLKK